MLFRSPNFERRWVEWSGSSFATALATGIIAATMSPGDGTNRTAEEAVKYLKDGYLQGSNTLPVPLPTGPFPPNGIASPAVLRGVGRARPGR